MIIYSNWLVPKGFSAMTAWPFIFIRPASKEDKPLVVHEMVHYKEQAWVSPVWWVRYGLSVKFRVAAEVRAYKAQLAAGGLTIASAAKWLMKYDDSLTNDQAVELLTK